ncbi:MAG: hypothetical protein WCH79_02680 [Planctomycetia bacterium]
MPHDRCRLGAALAHAGWHELEEQVDRATLLKRIAAAMSDDGGDRALHQRHVMSAARGGRGARDHFPAFASSSSR